MRVVFVGLGTMGLPMANCLAKSFEVSGWDASQTQREKFDQSCETPEQDLSRAECVVTMLPEGEHVTDVYRNRIFPNVQPGTLLIDCSTIDVETTKALSGEAEQRKLHMVDAPVSGGPEGAAAGSLSFMTGGNDEAIKLATPLLEVMGAKLTHFGQAGSGQAAKACHNMIIGVTAIGVCESFALAKSLGLDAGRFFDMCQGAAAQSWVLENRCPVAGPAPKAPASNDYAPGFAARLMAKDLRLAQAAAVFSGQDTPFGKQAAEQFTQFAESGDGDLDFSAIYRTIAKS
jgi:3-hydroxyisobutyrate dehydrogenase